MKKTLEYYFCNGLHMIFYDYTIDNLGVIRNIKDEKSSYYKQGKYNKVTISNTGKQYKIYIARALASTFIGEPPTKKHTADHINRNTDDDTIDNIRWLCKSGQRKNQDSPEIYKTAFLVTRYGIDKTIKEWVDHLKYEKNSFGHMYTIAMINKYAQKKQFEFSYKEYPDLDDEIWKEIVGSKTSNGGYWMISNMNRVKYITKFAENVLSGERLGLSSGYPTIRINKKHCLCHILAFMTFFPKDYEAKKSEEMVLHENDDKLDFRPHKLRLGTRSDNSIDAHNNGKYDDTKSKRVRCASYIDGDIEKTHESQSAAVEYLKSKGYLKASCASIRKGLHGKRKNGESNIAYDRTWKCV